jgi:hypothetical protein
MPDWSKIGTAGSFFTNPIVDTKTKNTLIEKDADIPAYLHHTNNYEEKRKISA